MVNHPIRFLILSVCLSLTFFGYLNGFMDFPAENIKDKVKDFLESENLRSTIWIKIGLGIILLISCFLVFPHPESSEYRYYVGAVWTERDLIAPFSFPIYKDLHRYEQEREEAIRAVKPVYFRNDSNAQISVDATRASFRSIEKASIAYWAWMKSKKQSDSLNYFNALQGLPLGIKQDEWKVVFNFVDMQNKSDKNSIQNIFEILESKLADIYKSGLLDKPLAAHSEIALRKKSIEEIIPARDYFNIETAINLVGNTLSSNVGDHPANGIILKLIRQHLKPNIVFSVSTTNEVIQTAADNVPRTLGYVSAHDLIIGKNEPITEQTKLKLDSFRRARAEHNAFNNGWKHWFSTTVHIGIILTLFALYLFLFRKKIFQDNGKLSLITIIILIEIIFGYLSVSINVQEPLQYLIFVPVASMLLAIIFDTRVAFYGTVTIAFLIAGIRGNDYAIALSSIVAGALAAYTVRDIRSRTQIFWSMIYIFVGYALSILALSIEHIENITQIMLQGSFIIGNAIFSPLITYGLVLLFEKMFHVTTDLRLAELADFNSPLLIELSEKAPGTFHHSVTIGNLAEAAAEAIGANSILARVGGYYHDIGKLLKPEYFIENQVGPHSRHNRLKPRMSALIISAHVREGIELGREHGIPEAVLDFIPQHHGTTRISFFFDKALKQAAKRPTKDGVREEDFLYPGPKPQTKETGIVMLADSVEATTRTISELTPQKLESAIDNMIKHRFMDGQLDECELTLRDLTKIKEGFLKILLGIHHHRIKYPEPDTAIEESTAESKQPELLVAKSITHNPVIPPVVEDEVYIPAMAIEVQPTQPAMHPDKQATKQVDEENSAQNP
ncbi:MAG: HDIG domain-containing protein [Ignavibacteriales bacterium]|nr:HDIG domain-containing protein [Ignavibacteriales bacterium]